MSNIQKLNISLFHWAEFLTIGILCLFFDVINHSFFFIYFAVLITIGTLKLIARIRESPIFYEMEDYQNDCSILGYTLFLSEFSLIFLTYTKVNVSVPFIVTIVGIILGTFYIIVGKNIKISIVKPIFIISVISLAVSMLTHQFNISTELIKLSFTLSLILLFDYKESYKGGMLLLTAACILLIINHEVGSCFILLLGYDIFCLSSDNKRIRKKALIITVLIVVLWSLIFFPPLYDLIISLIDIVLSDRVALKSTVYNIMERLFYHYSPTDQLPLLHSLIDNRSILTKLTCIFSPAEFTEIVKFENGSSTSSADYLYSLILYYLGPIAGIIISSSSILVYNGSLRKNIESEYRIIPILLLSQTLIHICGNMMLLPFTGIPYPFLSHGTSNLITSFILVFIISHYEMKGDS